MSGHTWGDGPVGEVRQIVTVDLYDPDSVRMAAVTRHPDGRLESVGVLFVDYCADAIKLARQVIAGDPHPAILADWVEDHPEWWRCPCPERNEAVRAICERLRAVPFGPL